MTGKRSHSRGGADSPRAAHDGADAVRGPDSAASLEDASRQAFAKGGHLTGQGPQPQQPTNLERATVDFGMHENIVRERDEFKADLQRLAAEFENYRKRAARERESAAAAADAKLLGELLVVVDDFERAMQQADGETSPLAQGIAMVHARLQSVLQQYGLAEIDATGTFDPNFHEAILLQPAEGVADGAILQCAQKGYLLGDRVLRHSKVVVAGS